MKSIIMTLALSLTLPLLASHHDHDDHEDFPEGTLLVLEGKDAVTRKDCALYVTDVGFTGPEETADQFYAVILTSYTHGEDQPDPITVMFNQQDPSILTGFGANQKDQVALFTESGSQDLAKVKSFSLRWFHHNHFDNFRCTQLKAHEH